MAKVSLRRCIVCRKSTTKGGLLRVVLRGGALLLDSEKKLPGRGAYIHSALKCWSGMKDERRWEKAFFPPSRQGRTKGHGEGSESISKASLEELSSKVWELIEREGKIEER